MSLYQSSIRQTIQQDIYNKPTFTMKLFDKEYFWTIKTKKLGPITLKRYQILGIHLPDNPEEIRKAIRYIKQKFWQSWTNIFFQRGIVTPIVSFDVYNHKNPEFASDLRDSRIFLREYLWKHYHLKHSFRENLPESWIIYDLTKTDEELLHEMNKGSKLRTKKGIRNDITFKVLEENEYDKFFDKRQQTAGKKWFNTISKAQYIKLITHLSKTQTGNVVVTEHNGEILAGAICIFYHKSIVCLYSFADRKHNNIWGQQYMKFKIFGWGRDHGFTTCDMMGGAPTGFPEHELASVSAFKESMWGIKTEYQGNADIILNPFLYKLFKREFKLRK